MDMQWIEASLEAYRSMVELLVAMRSRLQEDLRASHGERWYEGGVPGPVQERLAAKKDLEDTVAWYSSGERELFDYVDFSDMIAILDGQAAGIELLAGVFPQQQILRARLSELQVLSQKLAHAHPVADEELSLLGNLRVRLHLPAIQMERGSSEAATQVGPESTGPAAPAPSATVAPPQARTPPPETQQPPATPKPPQASEKPAAPQPKPVPVEIPSPAPRAIPRSEGPRSAPPTPSFDEVLQALDRRQTPVVLRALYAEIMAAAEAVWARGTSTSLKVWYSVRESPWYQDQFVPLGLKSVSDFYSIVEDLQATLGGSAPKDKVHDFLNSRAFAQVLLSLRELFQRALKT